MIIIDCIIEINRKMQAAIKFIHFFKILPYLNDYIQSNLQKKTIYMYAKNVGACYYSYCRFSDSKLTSHTYKIKYESKWNI